MCIDYLSSSVLAVSQQYINIETVKSTSLPSCKNDTTDSIATVNFLAPDGQVISDRGFVTVCLKKNSSSYGWALIHDDHMTDRMKFGAMHAACRQNGYFGSPQQISIQMYVCIHVFRTFKNEPCSHTNLL